MNPQQPSEISPEQKLEETDASNLTSPLPLTALRVPQKPRHIILWTIAGVMLLAGLITSIGWAISFLTRPKLSPYSAATLKDTYDNLSRAGISEFTPGQKTAILASYDELAGDFTIDDAFYADSTQCLHALGIASLYAANKTDKDVYRNELYLLSRNHMTEKPPGIDDKNFANLHLSQAEVTSLLNHYKDESLTQKVNESAKLKEVTTEAAKNLKLADTSKLAPHKIIVFGFDSTDEKFTEFSKKYNLYGAKPTMFALESEGLQYIVMMKPYAEEFLAGNAGALPHEFIHTEHTFLRGEAGRLIEQRRAELFSGDKSAYFEAKQLATYLEVFSGVSIVDLLREHPTDPAAFYTKLYARLGVKGANAAVFTWSNAFLAESSESMKFVDTKLHGANTALTEAKKLGEARYPASMQDRMKNRMEKLLSIFHTKEAAIQDLRKNVDELYRMPVAANAMIDYINSH